MKKISGKLKQIITSATVFVMLASININAVSFNEGQAKSDLSSIIDPILRVGTWLCFGVAAIAVVFSFITWAMKDTDEREKSPFTKSVTSIVTGLIMVGIGLMAVRWFVF